MTKGFTHLHNHSHFSLKDAINSPEQLCQFAKNDNSPAIALTDHGTMAGSFQMYKHAMSAGIKFIPGIEIYCATRSINETNRAQGNRTTHLTVLAINNEGWTNLLEIIAHAHLYGMSSGKPRCDKSILKKHSKGLVALSGCQSSQLSRAILSDDLEVANETIDEFQSIFGKENFFLEIMRIENPAQSKVEQGILKIHKDRDIQLVATNDIHWPCKGDEDVHDTMICFQAEALKSERDRMRYDTKELYYKSSKEMREIFWDLPRACDNTLLISEMCNVTIDIGKPKIRKWQNDPDGLSGKQRFDKECQEGFTRRYDSGNKIALERLKYESDVLEKMGFQDYFLILWDVMKFCKKNRIPIGPGRGSSAGSIVAYCLGITDIDPLKYKLTFERFINVERKSLPDIDSDFCKIRREEVITYLRTKYGEENVSKIGTFSRLTPKVLVNELAKKLQLDFEVTAKIQRRIPDAASASLKDLASKDPELQKLIDENEYFFKTAFALENKPIHSGSHAAGIAISQDPIRRVVPITRDKKTNEIVTQVTMEDVEAAGLVKIDFLGIKTLSILQQAAELIDKNDPEKILEKSKNIDDQYVYEKIFQTGDVLGIFQFESPGISSYLKSLCPTKFEQIIDLNALYRPGPMQCISGKTKILRSRYFDTRKNKYYYEYQTIEELYEQFENLKNHPQSATKKLGICSLDETTKLIVDNKILKVWKNGKKKLYRINVATNLDTWGKIHRLSLETTENHKFLTPNGWKELKDLSIGDYVAICHDKMSPKRGAPKSNIKGLKNFRNICFYNYLYKCVFCDWNQGTLDVNHIEGNRKNNNHYNNLCFLCPNHHRMYSENKISKKDIIRKREKYKIRFNDLWRFAPLSKIEEIGENETYDISVESPNNNYIAGKYIVHNSGMLDSYIERKNDSSKIESMHPLLDELLADTYHLMVYQEQVMGIARILAGYTPGMADELRKGMGKKKPEYLAKERSRFIQGCRANNIDDELSQNIFEKIQLFAGYAFCKAHSTPYTRISFQCAWFRAYYPKEFTAANMNFEGTGDGMLQAFMEDAKRNNIKILQPCVNKSDVFCTIEDSNIRLGLTKVKEVGEETARKIVENRKEGGYKSLADVLVILENRENGSTKI